MDPGDQELWRGAAAGDHQAFHVLVDRHGPALFRTALSLSANRCDAEDLCQETFAAAYHGLKNFDGRATFRTWLTSILVHRAAKAWRKSRAARRTLSISRDGDNGDPGAATASPEPSVAPTTVGVEQRLDVTDVIRSLAPEFRDVVVLREIEGLSYQEIADALAVPRGTVESRLHRARAELRRKLTGY